MPEGGAYNAGTIFLRVVPVFEDLQNAIQREARKANRALGDEMEKGGHDAGKRAGEGINAELEKSGKDGGEKYSGAFAKSFRDKMRGLNRELGPIKTKIEVEDDDVRKTFDDIQRRANRLRDVKIGIDVTSREASAELAKIEAQLKLLHEQASDIQVKADIKAARTQIESFVKEIQHNHADLKIEADFKGAQRELGAFEKKFQQVAKSAAANLSSSIDPEVRKIRAELDSLGDAEIGIDIDDHEAQVALKYLQAELVRVGAESPEVTVRANVARAAAELGALNLEMDRINGRHLEATVDVDTSKANKGIGDTANNFRALNLVILAAVMLIPALVPIIGAVAGALLALGPAIAGVTAGFGVMILGFSGVGNALQALNQQQKASGKEAETQAKAVRSAGRSLADAERSVTNARRQAAQQNIQAAQSVADAERSSARAVQSALQQRADAVRNAAQADRDAAQAQRDLVKARQQARKDLQDNRDQIAQNKLDQRQGVIDVFNATVANQGVQSDPGATNLEKEQASLALDQARLRLKESREQAKELAKQQKQGVEGNAQVQNAEDSLTKALERQRDAHRAVGRASQAVDRARVDGARQVARAVAAQQQTEANGQRAIADAQRNLQRAQQDYNTSLNQTSTAANNVADAMSRLSPAGREFVRYLWSLRDEFYAIRDAAQRGMLPGVQDAIQRIISRNGPLLMKFVRSMSGTIGQMFRLFGRMLTSPLWTQFFGMLTRLGPHFMKAFGKVAMDWLSFFARVMTIAAPWAKKLADAMVGISNSALKWIKSKKGADTIRDFLRYAAKVGPGVVQFFEDLWGAILNLGIAMAPVGGLVLDLVDHFLKWIAAMDPKTLGTIVVAIMTMVGMFQVLNAVVAVAGLGMRFAAIMTAGFAAEATLLEASLAWLLLGIAAVIAIIGILVILYLRFPAVRKVVNAALHAIGDAISWLWKNVAKPLLTLLWKFFVFVFKAIAAVWNHVLYPVFKVIFKVIAWLWNKIVHPYLKFVLAFWTTVFKAMAWYWNHILFPVLDLFGHVIAKLWNKYVRPYLTLIKAGWGVMGDKIHDVWVKVIKPIIDVMVTAVRQKLVGAFKWAADQIGKAWRTVERAVGKPIHWVIQTVLNNGIIAAFNKMAKFVGSKPMSPFPVPDWTYAKGGVMPGYTPGRDVHHFTSPTGGRLHLSGGEAFMVPEWTAAVGADNIARWNDLARRKGPKAVAADMRYGQHFANGGVYWPTTGHRTSSYPGHDGVDINGPGQDAGQPIFAYRSGKIVYAGWGRGYGHAIFEKAPGYPTVVYGHGSAVYVHTGQNVRGGQMIGRVGSTGNSTGPHLHFGIPGGTEAQALALLRGGRVLMGAPDGSGGPHLPKWLGHILGAPAKWAKGLADKGIDKMHDLFGSNGLTDLLAGAAHKLVDGIANKVLGFVGDAGDGSVANIKGPVKSVVHQIAAEHGWGSGAEWSALSKIIQSESGWNPNAANPSSSARGLFQKMTSIHGPLEKTVAGQAAWGLGYIRSRYGDPVKAWKFHLDHGWYKDGGVYGGPDGDIAPAGVPDNGTSIYDTGGPIPPGLTHVLNLTGQTERIYTHEDNKALLEAAGNGGGWHYEPHFEGSDLTADDVAADLDFAFRSLPKHGKYGRP